MMHGNHLSRSLNDISFDVQRRVERDAHTHRRGGRYTHTFIRTVCFLLYTLEETTHRHIRQSVCSASKKKKKRKKKAPVVVFRSFFVQRIVFQNEIPSPFVRHPFSVNKRLAGSPLTERQENDDADDERQRRRRRKARARGKKERNSVLRDDDRKRCKRGSSYPSCSPVKFALSACSLAVAALHTDDTLIIRSRTHVLLLLVDFLF